MPYIYHLKCDNCEHEYKASESGTYVILEDGSEKICPYPGEFWTAEEATGQTWSELVKKGRIVYRNPLVCRACGDLDYYGPRDLNIIMPPQSHLSGIVNRPSKGVVKLYECRSCRQNALEPLTRYGYFSRTLMDWIRGKRYYLDCKICGKGKYIPLPGAKS